MKKNFTAIILITVISVISVAGLITGVTNHQILVSIKDTVSTTEAPTTNNTAGETTTEPQASPTTNNTVGETTTKPESTTLSAEAKSRRIKEASELLNRSTTNVLAEVDSFSKRNVSGKFAYNNDSGMYYLIRFSNEPDDPYSDSIGIIDAYTLKSKDDYVIKDNYVFLNVCNTILYWPIGGAMPLDLYDSAIMANEVIRWPLTDDQLNHFVYEMSR